MADADIIKRGVPFRVTDPERIPTQRYYDEEFYRLEIEKVWPHVWQMAARLEQIPEVGDWIEYNNLGKSVIVVRTKSGVKAFHNACRHRGVQLTDTGGHGNCKTQGSSARSTAGALTWMARTPSCTASICSANGSWIRTTSIWCRAVWKKRWAVPSSISTMMHLRSGIQSDR
jgi:nitrite reductase/ring-hydroxylating ferredoxin subunit